MSSKINLDIIRVKSLAEACGITPNRLYKILVSTTTGEYANTLTPDEKNRLINALYDGTNDLFKFLGAEQTINKPKKASAKLG